MRGSRRSTPLLRHVSLWHKQNESAYRGLLEPAKGGDIEMAQSFLEAVGFRLVRQGPQVRPYCDAIRVYADDPLHHTRQSPTIKQPPLSKAEKVPRCCNRDARRDVLQSRGSWRDSPLYFSRSLVPRGYETGSGGTYQGLQRQSFMNSRLVGL